MNATEAFFKPRLVVAAGLAILAAGALHAQTAKAAGAHASAAQAPDNQPIVLARHDVVGEQWASDEGMESATKFDIRSGDSVVKSVNQKGSEKRLARFTYIAVDPQGKVSAVRVVFSPDCDEEKSDDSGQAPTITHQDFAGHTVTVKRDPASGAVTLDSDATLTEAEKKELENAVLDMGDFLPSKPVKVGDTWSPPSSIFNKGGEMQPGDTAVVTCTLQSVTREQGRRLAIIGLVGQLEMHREFLVIQMHLNGTARVDVATGEQVRAEIDGQGDISGATDDNSNGQPIHLVVSGTMRMRMHSTHTPLHLPTAD